MKRFLLLLIIITFTGSFAFAADDPVDRAMKLYEKRHYEDAAALRMELSSVVPAKQGAAYLTLGMIYLKSAELYSALYQESLGAAQDYLKKLSVGQGKGRSRFADFYMGQALIEAGRQGAAVTYLDKIISDETLDPQTRAIAKANLGLCYYLSDDKQKAETLWNSIDSTDPEVRAELASIYSTAGLKDKNPEAMCDTSLGDMKKSGKTVSMRMAKNSIAVFARAGLTEKGLDLLKRMDAKAYSHREVMGKTKIITFYDLSLLGDVSTLYGQASISYLEKAAADATVAGPAYYYLGQAYTLFGSAGQSSKVTQSFASASRLPQHYKDRAQVWQAAYDYQTGRKTDATAVWNDVSHKQDLDLSAEVLLACARTKADCAQIAKRAESAVESGQGKKVSVLNNALGKYYLSKKNTAKALASLEAGRDKSNKNKIEANDPLMLVDLAGLYYRNKKFSEALEIYFEMSKQFPAVRQIQESMQGVYAIEQKSAGDVKIF